MDNTDESLLQLMQIGEAEIERRNNLFGLGKDELQLLRACKPFIEEDIEIIVGEFYATQLSFPEIASIIGDEETLQRLHRAQRQYVLDLFGGEIGPSYVNNRLRIGLVHKKIGVEPKLYLSAMKLLKDIIYGSLERHIPQRSELRAAYRALDKLLHFDLTLVFDTYIGGLVNEVETAKKRVEGYAKSLELEVAQRTRELEDKVLQLQSAMATVKKLEGVIPICSSCKKIRDDKESWQQMEKYISEHSEAMFSHGLCPDCYRREMDEILKLRERIPNR